jgi:hypothetical protein
LLCYRIEPKRKDAGDSPFLEIVALAKSLQPKRPLKYDEVNKLSKSGKFVSNAVIVKRFGTMGAFQSACGFKPIRKSSKHN